MKAGGGGRNTSGIGAKRPDYSSNTFGGGQDNNPNRDEYENKPTVAKVYEKTVDLFKSFGAKEPEALIVDGKRVYQGPLFSGYDPTVRIGPFGGDAGKKQYRFGMPFLGEVSPSYPSPTLPSGDNNPALNMFGVRRGFTRGTDMPELSVSPEAPANMDPLTRGLSQAMLPQASPEMVDYTVGSLRDKENLMTIVEDLNKRGVDVTLEEVAKANNLPVNADGTPTNPFVENGEVIKIPTTRKPTVPTEFMDNATKAMLRDATPIKANFITESLSSLTGKLSSATKDLAKETKDLVNSYTTSTTKGLATKDTSTYKVERGDTMYDIAKRQGVTLDKLMEANPDVDADKIGVGQVISIPRGGELNNLPSDVQAEVATAINNGDVKNEEDLTLALYDASTFKGIPPIRQGENLIEYLARSGMIGVDEADPQFIEAFKEFGTGSNPKTRAWCANLLGNLIRKSGGSLPFDNKPQSEQNAYMEGSQNFERLGKTIYNHNPNTGKTYKGKPSDVKAGDIIIFNNKLDGTRQDNGDFKYPNEAPGKGHVSVVLEVRDDGSIVALGGNQSAGATSYITGGKSKGGIRASLYTPEIMKQYYKGGFKINRLTDTSLTQADPEIVAAIIKDAGLGGDGQ
jgi:LysM repeat protein